MYKSPEPKKLGETIKSWGWTRLAAANECGLSLNGIAKMLGGKNPRKASYSVLFTLSAKKALNKNELSRVEKKMQEFYK